MIYLLTFCLALPSGVIWLFNAEVMVVAQMTANPTAVPWLIALMTVLGQFIGYVVLYTFAAKILTRWDFVRRAVAKVKIPGANSPSRRGRGEARADRNAAGDMPARAEGWATWTLFLSGGLIGFPPLLGLFTLYGSKRIGPLTGMLLCAMPARFLWYCGWAFAADWMSAHLSFLSCS